MPSGVECSGGRGGGPTGSVVVDASSRKEKICSEGKPKVQKKMKDTLSQTGGEGAGGAPHPTAYLSPISYPLLEGKLLRRCLKLIHVAADRERASRSLNSSNKAATTAAVSSATQQQQKHQQQGGHVGGGVSNIKGGGSRSSWKLLRRGVHEVTKCLRRDMKGIVFFASDVFPIEIIAHLPVLCEEKDVLYAYLCSKRTLGHAFRSQRPASVIMLTPDPTVAATSPTAATAAAANKKQKRDVSTATAGQEEEEAEVANDEESFEILFKKIDKALRKIHPYF